jgi:hypothetical protein
LDRNLFQLFRFQKYSKIDKKYRHLPFHTLLKKSR